MRGTLRNFGLKVGVVSKITYETRIRHLVDDFPRLAAIVEPLLTVRRVTLTQTAIEKRFPFARRYGPKMGTV